MVGHLLQGGPARLLEGWPRLTPDDLEQAAFAAFYRNMAEYEIPDLHTAFYGDQGVRQFWMAEARAWAESLGVAA